MLTHTECFASPTPTSSRTLHIGTHSGAPVQLLDVPYRSRVSTVITRVEYVAFAVIHAGDTTGRDTSRATVTTMNILETARRHASALQHCYPSADVTISIIWTSHSSRHHRTVPLLVSHDSMCPNRHRVGASLRGHPPACQQRNNHNQPAYLSKRLRPPQVKRSYRWRCAGRLRLGGKFRLSQHPPPKT